MYTAGLRIAILRWSPTHTAKLCAELGVQNRHLRRLRIISFIWLACLGVNIECAHSTASSPLPCAIASRLDLVCICYMHDHSVILHIVCQHDKLARVDVLTSKLYVRESLNFWGLGFKHFRVRAPNFSLLTSYINVRGTIALSEPSSQCSYGPGIRTTNSPTTGLRTKNIRKHEMHVQCQSTYTCNAQYCSIALQHCFIKWHLCSSCSVPGRQAEFPLGYMSWLSGRWKSQNCWIRTS